MFVHRKARHRRRLAASLATIAAATTLTALVGLAAGPATASSKSTIGPCPSSNSLGTYKAASNVGATYSRSGAATTYQFYSFADENPTAGIPGLVSYCVYPSGSPASAEAVVEGADGSGWKTSIGTNNFGFIRPGGNKTNIPLDGTAPITMGTATWGDTAPADQRILLHIADPGVCYQVYGATVGTCFVFPGNDNPEQPICNNGTTAPAYNVMPFGVENCSKPSWGFEARNTNEFGDQVSLKPGTPRTLDSLRVLFHSYACSDSGKWDDPNKPCVTSSATFSHEITARIYAVDTGTTPPSVGDLLATSTATFAIPYRPSADPTCGDPANSADPARAQWYNAAAGYCQYGISKVLTFDTWTNGGSFTGTLPDNVIWTVAFNTTSAGYTPIGSPGVNNCTTALSGCPYDSLNVGTMDFVNAPYAGSSDAATDGAFVSAGCKTAPLVRNTAAYGNGWAGYTPLAAITTQ